MTNYNNGKIYKLEPICEYEEGNIYIGSTTKEYLCQRLATHKRDYKQWKKKSLFLLRKKNPKKNLSFFSLLRAYREKKSKKNALKKNTKNLVSCFFPSFSFFSKKKIFSQKIFCKTFWPRLKEIFLEDRKKCCVYFFSLKNFFKKNASSFTFP